MHSILSDERLSTIRDRLFRDGRVSANGLADEFTVSEDTIRRDLRTLAAEGVCERVYGGAVRRAARTTSLAERMTEDMPMKRALGASAASLVQAGETVFIDAGSTNLEIARALAPRDGLTIVTNAPVVAEVLRGSHGPQVVMIGGRFDKALGACVGAEALAAVTALNPDRAFIGTCGIDLGAGLSAFSSEEARLKRGIAEQSRLICVAASFAKLTLKAPFSFAPIGALSHLVTEAGDHPVLSDLRKLGIPVSSPAG